MLFLGLVGDDAIRRQQYCTKLLCVQLLVHQTSRLLHAAMSDFASDSIKQDDPDVCPSSET